MLQSNYWFHLNSLFSVECSLAKPHPIPAQSPLPLHSCHTWGCLHYVLQLIIATHWTASYFLLLFVLLVPNTMPRTQSTNAHLGFLQEPVVLQDIRLCVVRGNGCSGDADLPSWSMAVRKKRMALPANIYSYPASCQVLLCLSIRIVLRADFCYFSEIRPFNEVFNLKLQR